MDGGTTRQRTRGSGFSTSTDELSGILKDIREQKGLKRSAVGKDVVLGLLLKYLPYLTLLCLTPLLYALWSFYEKEQCRYEELLQSLVYEVRMLRDEVQDMRAKTI